VIKPEKQKKKYTNKEKKKTKKEKKKAPTDSVIVDKNKVMCFYFLAL